MKQRLSTLLALVLALTLFLTPAASAAGGQISQITLSGLRLDLDGQDAVDIGLRTSVSYGTNGDGAEIVTIDLAGAQDILSITVGEDTQDGVVRASVEGLSSALEIQGEELLAQAGDDPSVLESQDMAQMWAILLDSMEICNRSMQRYCGDAQEMRDINARYVAQAVAENLYTLGPVETVQMLDEQVSAQRYDFCIDAAQTDRLMEIQSQVDDLYRRLYENSALLEQLMGDGQYPADRADTAKYGQAQFQREGSTWISEDGRYTRTDLTDRYAEEKGAVHQMRQQSFHTVTCAREDGVTTYGLMDLTDQGVVNRLEFNLICPSAPNGGGLRADCSWRMQSEEQANAMPEDVLILFSLEKGAERINLNLSASADWLGLYEDRAEITFEGKTQGPSMAGSAQIRTLQRRPDWEDAQNLVTFDISVSPGDWPQQRWDELWAMPAMDALNMTEEEQRKLDTEIQTLSIMAAGALMQTPGVARYISQAIAATEQAYEHMMRQQQSGPKLEA